MENKSFNMCPICRTKISVDERWCSKHRVKGEILQDKTIKSINNVRKAKGLKPIELKRKITKDYTSIDKIYFIKEHSGGHIKIGKAKGFIDTTLKALQIANPYKLELLYVTCQYTKDELHKRFKGYKVRGEWFSKEIESKIIDAITTKNKR